MANNAPVFEFTSPVGRLVSGDAFEPQTKNMNGQPLTDKNGQPTKKWFIGVAFDKNNPEFAAFYQGLQRQAMQDFPHLFDQQTGQCRSNVFSMKVIDGDGFDQAGKPWAEREGYAGHWIVRMSSGFAPSVYHKGRYDPMARVTDPSALQRGYFVRVAGKANGNGDAQKPGLFVNHNMVEIFGYGPVISGGPNAGAAFGETQPQPAYIPQGMTQAPVAQQMPGGMPGQPMQQPQGQMPMQGGMPGQPQMQQPQGQMPMQGGMPGQPQMQQPQGQMPMQGGMPGQQMQQPQPDQSFIQNAAGMQPQIQMGPQSQGFTYEQWKQYGYTDDQMRAGGIII